MRSRHGPNRATNSSMVGQTIAGLPASKKNRSFREGLFRGCCIWLLRCAFPEPRFNAALARVNSMVLRTSTSCRSSAMQQTQSNYSYQGLMMRTGSGLGLYADDFMRNGVCSPPPEEGAKVAERAKPKNRHIYNSSFYNFILCL